MSFENLFLSENVCSAFHKFWEIVGNIAKEAIKAHVIDVRISRVSNQKKFEAARGKSITIPNFEINTITVLMLSHTFIFPLICYRGRKTKRWNQTTGRWAVILQTKKNRSGSLQFTFWQSQLVNKDIVVNKWIKMVNFELGN